MPPHRFNWARLQYESKLIKTAQELLAADQCQPKPLNQAIVAQLYQFKLARDWQQSYLAYWIQRCYQRPNLAINYWLVGLRNAIVWFIGRLIGWIWLN